MATQYSKQNLHEAKSCNVLSVWCFTCCPVSRIFEDIPHQRIGIFTAALKIYFWQVYSLSRRLEIYNHIYENKPMFDEVIITYFVKSFVSLHLQIIAVHLTWSVIHNSSIGVAFLFFSEDETIPSVYLRPNRNSFSAATDINKNT